MIALNLIKDSHEKDLGNGNLENFAYLWKNTSYVTNDLPWVLETSYETSRDISTALDCKHAREKDLLVPWVLVTVRPTKSTGIKRLTAETV